MSKPHILFIDSFDSFAFNLADAFSLLGAEVDIYRHNISAETALSMAREKHSVLMVLATKKAELIQKCAGEVALLGLCQGYHAVVEAFGGKMGAAKKIMHGKKSLVKHRGHALFSGLSEIFEVGSYHSWAVQQLPKDLDAIATDAKDEGLPMALAHRFQPTYGLQFHPESILTTYGQVLLSNVFQLAMAGRRR